MVPKHAGSCYEYICFFLSHDEYDYTGFVTCGRQIPIEKLVLELEPYRIYYHTSCCSLSIYAFFMTVVKFHIVMHLVENLMWSRYICDESAENVRIMLFVLFHLLAMHVIKDNL